MRPSMRLRLVILGLLAALLGGGLWAWLARGDGTSRGVQFEPVEATPRTESGLAANPREVSGGPPDRSAVVSSRVLHVRVVDAATGEAVVDAALSVVELGDVASLTKLRPILGTAGSAATDGEGRASIVMRTGGAPVTECLRVSHPAFLTETIEDGLPVAEDEFLVRLSKGRAIGGVVRDRLTGRGVPGLTVTITPRELPADVWGVAILVGSALRDASALTDANGSFQSTVPDGTYVLRAGGTDWFGARQRPGLVAAPEHTVAEAGDMNVRIEVERLRFIRFELRDSVTHRLVTQALAGFLVFEQREDVASNGPGSPLAPTSVWHDGTWSDLMSTRRPSWGVFVGTVPARGMDLDPGAKPTLRIGLMAPGYRQVSAAVRLLTGDEFRSGAIDSISLVREGEGPPSSMLVRLEGPPFQFGDAGTPLLVLASESGDILAVYFAAEVEAGTWRVDALPVGRFRVHVYDNARRSAPQIVELRPDLEITVTFQMPEATGILVDVHGAGGPMLSDPDVWVTSADGTEMRLEGTMRGWSTIEALGSSAAPFFSVEPGSYKVSVYARCGLGWYASNVDVAQDQVVTVRGQLRAPVR